MNAGAITVSSESRVSRCAGAQHPDAERLQAHRCVDRAAVQLGQPGCGDRWCDGGGARAVIDQPQQPAAVDVVEQVRAHARVVDGDRPVDARGGGRRVVDPGPPGSADRNSTRSTLYR